MLSVAESRADSSWGRTTRDFESPLELLLVATACSFPTRFLQPPRPPLVDVAFPLSELLDQPIDPVRVVRAHPAECSFVLLGKNPPAQHQIVVSLFDAEQLGAQDADRCVAVGVVNDALRSDRSRRHRDRCDYRGVDRHALIVVTTAGTAGSRSRSLRCRFSLGALRSASRPHPLGVGCPLPRPPRHPHLLPDLRLLSLGNLSDSSSRFPETLPSAVPEFPETLPTTGSGSRKPSQGRSAPHVHDRSPRRDYRALHWGRSRVARRRRGV